MPNDILPYKRDRALILLLLSTGARISEVLRLDIKDWKPERMWVVGKGDREHVVQVTEKARAAAEEYLHARNDHSPALFIGFQPGATCQLQPEIPDGGVVSVRSQSAVSRACLPGERPPACGLPGAILVAFAYDRGRSLGTASVG